jgi:hypothetical protein
MKTANNLDFGALHVISRPLLALNKGREAPPRGYSKDRNQFQA